VLYLSFKLGHDERPAHLPAGLSQLPTPEGRPAPPVRCSGWFGVPPAVHRPATLRLTPSSPAAAHSGGGASRGQGRFSVFAGFAFVGFAWSAVRRPRAMNEAPPRSDRHRAERDHFEAALTTGSSRSRSVSRSSIPNNPNMRTAFKRQRIMRSQGREDAMASRRMTTEELTVPRDILDQARPRITQAGKGDPVFTFALRRYVYHSDALFTAAAPTASTVQIPKQSCHSKRRRLSNRWRAAFANRSKNSALSLAAIPESVAILDRSLLREMNA
jgi:hypothetical protein